MRQRVREGGFRIDRACKAAATVVDSRSVVWSHSYGSLQKTLLVILKTSLTACNTFRWKKGHGSKHTQVKMDGKMYMYSCILLFILNVERPVPWFTVEEMPSNIFLLEFYVNYIRCQIGFVFTFEDCSYCCRWGPELNQTKIFIFVWFQIYIYIQRFQIYNIGFGLGGILHCEILFPSCSLWKQLLKYSQDLGTVDGQWTSIKWSRSLFLYMVVLLQQLCWYCPCIILHTQTKTFSFCNCSLLFRFSSPLLLHTGSSPSFQHLFIWECWVHRVTIDYIWMCCFG